MVSLLVRRKEHLVTDANKPLRTIDKACIYAHVGVERPS